MSATRLLAQMTVTEAAPAQAWYAKLFGRDADARPMDGLAEWHLTDTFGFQVWAEPERAGNSTMVIDEDDLDGRAAQLDRLGIVHEGPLDATTTRNLQLADPDGNRIVFVSPLPSGN